MFANSPQQPLPRGQTVWTPPRVGVFVDSSNERVRSRAISLAAELKLPLVVEDGAGFDLLLVVAEEGLELRETGCGAAGPVRADFGCFGDAAYRRATTSRRQPIARAVGLKRGRPTVVDATAGLGRDTMVLAFLGCAVTAVERSPILGVMLRDGLERAAQEAEGQGELERVLRNRIRLIIGDAREVLTQLPAQEAPEVVYLDPMFPPKKKTALPKKEMRVLRRLVGDDPDAGMLLETARRVARARVVVKRTPHAPLLAPAPTMRTLDEIYEAAKRSPVELREALSEYVLVGPQNSEEVYEVPAGKRLVILQVHADLTDSPTSWDLYTGNDDVLINGRIAKVNTSSIIYQFWHDFPDRCVVVEAGETLSVRNRYGGASTQPNLHLTVVGYTYDV